MTADQHHSRPFWPRAHKIAHCFFESMPASEKTGCCRFTRDLPSQTHSGMHQYASTFICHLPRSVACHAVLTRRAQDSDADLAAPCMLDISLPAHTCCRPGRNGSSAVKILLSVESDANDRVLNVV
jgi:hypothetical protein